MGFVGVAKLFARLQAKSFASLTSLPQGEKIIEAKEKTEILFMKAFAPILILNNNGIIRKANQAAATLFNMKINELIRLPLPKKLPQLSREPQHWLTRSEPSYLSEDEFRILDATISGRTNYEDREYMVILPDITEQKKRKNL
jgi:nitrogen-specific signal transduction histidine kinase